MNQPKNRLPIASPKLTSEGLFLLAWLLVTDQIEVSGSRYIMVLAGIQPWVFWR